jgi:hypothetical protein
MVVAIVLSVALATLAIMAILAVGLLRHAKVLAASLRQFQEETHPLLEEIRRAGASAADRGAELRGSGDKLRR